MSEPKQGDLRVWWIPQIPGEQFHVDVASLAEAKKMLDVLAQYDIFQFENNIKPDYCNAGGLECYRQPGTWEEGDSEDWCEWASDWGDNIDNYEVPA